MKKILVRTGMTPFTETPVPEILAYDRIGINVGNIVYAYSIYRGLMTASDVEFLPTKYLVSRLNVEQINEECERFVIPLADFIRKDRMKEIKAMTKLINQLKIPCHIVGIGIRADYEFEKNGIQFDDKVAYDFFKAVLNKSPMIGLRGEITAEYLKKLGFIPEKDFTVIGCPSFYVNGEDIHIKDVKITKDARLALNNNVMRSEKYIQDFLTRTRRGFKNYYYYPQHLKELKTLYLGAGFSFSYKSTPFQISLKDEEYREGKIRFHTHYLSWLRDLREMDFSFGSRLHGNVMAMHAGLPSIWVVHDARMRELADYHNLPCISGEDIDEKTDVMELFAKIDYKSVLKGHAERFRHYIDFLEKSGIEHIYKDYKNPDTSPLDRKMRELGYDEKDFMVKSVLDCSIEEIGARVEAYDNLYIARRQDDLKVEDGIKKGLREERAELKKNLKLEEEKAKKAEELKSQLTKTKEELKTVKTELETKKKALEKTKAELEEAKKTLTFVVRRKVGKLIKTLKGQGNKSE